MSNTIASIITKDWMDAHDEVLVSKLKGLPDVKIVLTLDAPPANWETYTTYTIGTGASAEVHDFKEDDEVRVPDAETTNGFSYYKLIKFTGSGDNKTATWAKIGEGTDNYKGAIKVTLQAIVNDAQASGDDLIGLTVSVQNVTDSEAAIVKTWAGSELVFNQLTPMKEYLITVQTKNDTYVTKIGGNVGNTYTVASLGIAQEVSKTFQYCAEQYTISIDSNQVDKTDIANAKVTYNATQYANGAAFTVPFGTTIAVDGGSQNVTATDLTSTGYSCALSLTNHVISALYSTEVLSITSVTSDKAGDDFAGVTFTVNNVTKTYGTDTLTWKIPYGTSDLISANRTGFNVTITKSPNTDTADSTSKTATIAYEQIQYGVFAYYSDGTLLPYEQSDNTAIGVAVIDEDACFVIDKTNHSSSSKQAFGGQNRNLSSTGILITNNNETAAANFDGYRNTTKIINAYAGYTDSTNNVTGAPAAQRCRTKFSGKGYLAALGEWNTAYKYKTDINAMLTDKIGGTALNEASYNTSNPSNSSTRVWLMRWQDGTNSTYIRNNSAWTRAFCALNTSISLNLTSSDGTSVSGITVTVTDRTGKLQSVTTDSNGHVTVDNVAYGDAFVSVPKKQTINSTFKITPSNKTFTVGVITPPTGIFAYYSDGSLKTQAEADSTAIGVAVITSNCAFVIDKTPMSYPDGSSTNSWGGYNVDLTGVVTIGSGLNSTGQQDSAAIATALSGVNDNYRTGSASEDCQSRFNGKGYLGSYGEWRTIINNESEISSMMSIISNRAFGAANCWTSTIRDYDTSSYKTYINSINNTDIYWYYRNDSSGKIYAFSPL